ncbi:MAG: antibiotic biosynthesis monooxygenase [Gluconacetobacter diazotrophicus]|nr:antibiotic biosynthesis monooxygenase [Gluconacetobacter diazotrophicus]
MTSGRKGSRRNEKGLLIHLHARKGREAAVESLLSDIWEDVQSEPATAPWFAFRLARRRYGIFERFPDEAGRRAHLSGQGAARLLAQSNALLAKPARIARVEVLGGKFPE